MPDLPERVIFDMRIDVDHIVTIALFVSAVAAFAYLTYQIIELL